MTAKTTSSGRNQLVWQFWRGPSCGASGLPSAIEGVSPARVLETSSEALGGITKPVDCCQEAGVLPSNQGRRGPVGSVVGDRPKPCGSTWSCSRDPAPNRGVPLSVSCETFVRACLFGRTASPYDVLQKRRFGSLRRPSIAPDAPSRGSARRNPSSRFVAASERTARSGRDCQTGVFAAHRMAFAVKPGLT